MGFIVSVHTGIHDDVHSKFAGPIRRGPQAVFMLGCGEKLKVELPGINFQDTEPRVAHN